MFKSLILIAALVASGPVSAKTKMKSLKIGDLAPDFSLQGHDGKTYSLSQFKGKNVVVLEWFNKDCPYVQKFYETNTMQKLQEEQLGKGATKERPQIKWLTITSFGVGKDKKGQIDLAGAAQIYKDSGMKSTAYLIDPGGKTGQAYGAKATPHMYIIDKDGKLYYQGAIDDQRSSDKETLKNAQNYVVAAITAMEKGEKTPKEASTAPYGCDVKY
ncbi:MAG: redoxin family protein [Bdellovibrionales bacterium]